jgi:Flp pilus assembly protein TadG
VALEMRPLGSRCVFRFLPYHSIGNRPRLPNSPALPAVTLKSRRKERGAEIVEFGLGIAILMALVMGIITFARAYNIYESITRAAREGARMAVLPSSSFDGNTFIDGNTSGSTTTPIFTNYIAPALKAADLNPSLVTNYSETIGWLDTGDTQQQCGAVISFNYPYTLYLPFTSTNLTTVTLATHVQMRRENVDGTVAADGTVTVTCP